MIENLLAVYLVHLSYFALVFIPVISSIGFPFSEELLLLGAGYLAATGFIRLDLGFLLCLAGVIAGDNMGYLVGSQGGRFFYLLVSERRLKKAQKFFDKYGPKAVFIARFVPGVRFLMPLIVGASKMSYRKFFFYNTLGAFIVVPLGMGFGYYIGLSIDQIISITQELNSTVFFFLLIFLLAAAVGVCLFRKSIRYMVRESDFFDRWVRKGEEPYQMVTFGNPSSSSARRVIAKIRKCDGKICCLVSDIHDGSVKKFIKLRRWFSLKGYDSFIKRLAKKRRHKIEEWD